LKITRAIVAIYVIAVVLLASSITGASTNSNAGIKVSRAKINFGNQLYRGQIGQSPTSKPKSVTIFAPNGGAGISGLSVQESGEDRADFAIIGDTCPSLLMAGNSCPVTLTFTPTQYHRRHAHLILSDSETPDISRVALVGHGVRPSRSSCLPKYRSAM
jgi:hypothetical protein